jgi:putative ABC transport system permease protein
MGGDEPTHLPRLAPRERRLLDDANLPQDIRIYLGHVIHGSGLRDERRLDVFRELVAHFEDGVSAGRSSEELVREFGSVEVVSRRLAQGRRGSPSGSAGWWAGVHGVLRDLRLAVRALRRNPGYSIVVILTLGLGIGVNTAVFSVVNGVLLKPLPYPEPDRLAALFQTDARGARRLPWSVPNLRDIEEAGGAFTAVAGYRWRDLTLTGVGDPQLMYAVAVSGSLLRVFGVRPALGRDITRDETLPGGPAVVMVSHAFWKERLGGDSAVIGRTLQLSDVPYEIVGVAPSRFAYPRGAEIWVPGQWSESEFGRGRLTVRVIARLTPGATLEGAEAEVSTILQRLSNEHPVANAGMGGTITSLQDSLVGNVRLGLLVLLGAVAMVLLIACVNVANLVLVRGANRAGELAVRSSLGASRGTLLRQLLAESVVLSIAGGALGIVVARGGMPWLRVLSVGRIPRMDDVALDGTVLAFAAGLSVAVALLFGLAPALRLSRVSLSNLVRQRRGLGGGFGERRRARAGLLATEVALSVALLIGAGLLLRSFVQVRSVELGFDPKRVLQFGVTLPRARYDSERSTALFDALRERLTAIPGVKAVAAAFGSPFGSGYTSRTVTIVGEPARATGHEPLWLVCWVSPGYIRILGIPLLRGRDLGPSDRVGTPNVALISQAAASRFFANKDPVGQQFRFADDGPNWTIIGVVGDVRSIDLTADAEPEVYVPYAQWGRWTMTVMVRAAGDISGLAATIRREVGAMDPNLAIYDVQALDEAVAASTSTQRFHLVLLAIFAGLALLLAAVGLYGVVAYLVSGRTREIGIRIALGAKPANVARMVVAQGLRPVLVGVVIGVGGALAGAGMLDTLLYQVHPWDPVTFMGSAAMLLAVAAVACLVPARRASRTSPTEAMRAE